MIVRASGMKASEVVFLVFLILMSLCFVNTQPVKAAETAENSWTTMASMPTARYTVGVTAVNGKIYSIGGDRRSGFTAANEMYDPVTDTWTTKASMPTSRVGFAITAYENKIYCMGGTTQNGESTGLNEVYDVETDSWETKTPMPTPISGVSGNAVNDRIYVIGGSLTMVYDPETDSWANRTPPPVAVYNHASAAIDDRIYVVGGYVSNLNQIYDTTTDVWNNGTSPPNTLHYVAGASTVGVHAPKRIYMMGGGAIWPGTEDWVPPWWFPGDLNLIYDPETNAWSSGARLSIQKSNFGIAVVGDLFYVVGGYVQSGEGVAINTNEQYTPFGFGTVPPTISVVSPEKNTTYTVSDVSLAFTLSEPASWMGYSLDRQTNVTVTGNITLTDLPSGSHSLTVYANDTLGSMGASETVYFTIAKQSGFLGSSFPVEYVYGIVTVAAVSVVAVVGYMLLKRKKKGGDK
jgi:hypothetical protein